MLVKKNSKGIVTKIEAGDKTFELGKTFVERDDDFKEGIITRLITVEEMLGAKFVDYNEKRVSKDVLGFGVEVESKKWGFTFTDVVFYNKFGKLILEVCPEY